MNALSHSVGFSGPISTTNPANCNLLLEPDYDDWLVFVVVEHDQLNDYAKLISKSQRHVVIQLPAGEGGAGRRWGLQVTRDRAHAALHALFAKLGVPPGTPILEMDDDVPHLVSQIIDYARHRKDTSKKVAQLRHLSLVAAITTEMTKTLDVVRQHIDVKGPECIVGMQPARYRKYATQDATVKYLHGSEARMSMHAE
jgi:hypothetical protein